MATNLPEVLREQHGAALRRRIGSYRLHLRALQVRLARQPA
jgi:hypothetical protein